VPQAGASREGNMSRLHSLRRPHAFSDPLLVEEDISPIEENRTSSNRSSLYPDKTARFESFAGQRAVRGVSPPSTSSQAYEHNLPHDFNANSLSSQRADAPTSPIKPNVEVRIHGRGGAQARPKTSKDKDKKDKPSKTGGFRGLKGIM